MYLSLRKFQDAIESFRHRLQFAKDVGDKAGEVYAYGSLGNAYHDLGDFKKAIEYHQLCLSIASEIGDRARVGIANCNLGIAYLALGDFQKAIQYHSEDLHYARDARDIFGEGRASCNLGNTYQALGDLWKSESYYKRSLELFDEVRNRLQANDQLKISMREQYDEVYSGLMAVLLKQDKCTEALLTAERGRAEALTDLIESQYGVHVPVIFKENNISDILKYITPQTVFVAVGKKDLNLWVLQKGKDVRFRKNEIDDGTDATTFLWSLTKNAFKEIGVNHTVRCENRSEDDRADDDLADHKTGEEKRSSTTSNSKDSSLKILYEMIIDPIIDLIDGNELIVVPDRPLLLAPFAAFRDQSFNFLSESFSVRLIPSLSTLKLIMEYPESYHSKSEALLVGDPYLAEIRKVKGKRLAELPCARKEVKMIGEILNIHPLVGKEATKDEVIKQLKSSVALVHIAAHGSAETGEIYLSPNPERSSKVPKKEDYVLTMKDVLSIKLRARLVVLSCCHSGHGKIKAEGVVGIARAFLGAGARSVLAALWAINDEATLEFMKSFYQHLEKGESASKAINQARKYLKESKNYSDVKHWAPFMLIGDDVTLDFGKTE